MFRYGGWASSSAVKSLPLRRFEGVKISVKIYRDILNSSDKNERHAYRIGIKPVKFPVTKGEDNGRAVLTDEKVRAIRLSILPSRAAGKFFGICASQISGIRAGRAWSHVK